jgi:hypothetical protein
VVRSVPPATPPPWSRDRSQVRRVPALLVGDELQTLLQLAVKVNRQTQECSLTVTLASLRFGKVAM